MQPGDHRHDDGSLNRVGLMRGILVIVTAVAIGAFVLSRGLDDSSIEAVAAAGDEVATGDAEDSTTSTLADIAATTSTTAGSSDASADTESTSSSTTEPAAPVIRAPADVSVLVLNAAGAKGVAGRGSEQLQGAGYEVLAPKNATKLGPTAVLYTENFDAEAQAVAEVFGLDPVSVVAAYDPASPPINDIRDAIVIVVIGQDGLIDL